LDKKENSQKEEKPTGQAKKTKKQQRQKKRVTPLAQGLDPPLPEARFSKDPETFRAHKAILLYCFGDFSETFRDLQVTRSTYLAKSAGIYVAGERRRKIRYHDVIRDKLP